MATRLGVLQGVQRSTLVPPVVQKHNNSLIVHYKLTKGVNLGVNGCLSLYLSYYQLAACKPCNLGSKMNIEK